MTAGVPGTGVGGLFYLVAALVLPLRGLLLKTRGIHVSWPTILRQVRLAAGVFIGLWAMGWMLGWTIGVILGPAGSAQATSPLRMPLHPHYESVVRWAALIAGFATLALVLLTVQFARLVTRLRAR